MKSNILKKTILLYFVSALLLSAILGTHLIKPVSANPGTINVPGNYSTIQQAINAANPGDTIQVSAGTYYEHVMVGKSVRIIGAGTSTTFIDGGGEVDSVFYLTASGVTIRGFTIRNTERGVYISSHNNTVSDNVFIDSSWPIEVSWSNNNIISNNQFAAEYGPLFVGIFVSFSSGNIIIGNTQQYSESIGGGIALCYSENNTVTDNVVTNSGYGIQLVGSTENTVSDNDLEANWRGIILRYSNNNTFYHNNLVDNYGDNYGQVESSESSNLWDDGVGRGNYWGDYNGRDLNGDGVGDTNLPWQGFDYHPLMSRWDGTLPPPPPYGPTAEFIYSLAYVNQTMTFDASTSLFGWNGTSFTSIVSYAWDFGDGNQTTVSQPILTHKYSVDGDYLVTLNVTDTEGRWNKAYKQITVRPWTPVAKFEFSPSLPLAFDIVTFDASTSLPGWNGTQEMPIVSYAWNFGDGNITETLNPIITHVYTMNNTYTVTLKVTDTQGLWNAISKNVTVAPLLIEDDFESYVVGKFPYAGGWKLWYWGAVTGPLKVVDTVSFSPTKSLQLLGGPLGWPVTVAAYPIDWNSKTMAYSVYVMADEVGTFDFSAGVGFGKRVPGGVSYCGSVGFDSDGMIKAGYELTTLQPYEPDTWYKIEVVLNTTTKMFSVWIDDELKASGLDAGFPSSEIEAFVLVSGLANVKVYFDDVRLFEGIYVQGPKVNFTYSPSIPHMNQTITFDASTTLPGWDGTAEVPIANYAWDFGDGNQTTSSQPILTHRYSVEGDYSVILNVTDMEGRWNTANKQITINPWNPIANFEFSPPFPYLLDIVTFDGSSSIPGWNGTHDIPIVRYEWDFGDETNATGVITTHSYADTGTYVITLNAIDSQGLWGPVSKSVTVSYQTPPNGPTAQFTFDTRFPWVYKLVTFDASSSLPGFNSSITVPIANYTWDFGDGTPTVTTTSTTVTHIYTTKGTYTVSLTVACEDDPVLIKEGLISNNNSEVITVFASPPSTIVYVYPSHVLGDVGDTFKVYINIKDVEHLSAWGIDMSWDSSILECLNFTFNFSFFGPEDIVLHADGTINNTAGKMQEYTAAFFAGGPGVTGNGTLAQVEFRVLSDGWTSINLIDPPYGGLLNNLHEYIPFQVVNGYFGEPPPPHGPTAHFISPSGSYPNEIITFDASNSLPGWEFPYESLIVSYFWDFGDGTNTMETDPLTAHNYMAEGTYTVTLIVTDEQARWDATSQNITVSEPYGPTAFFTYSPPQPIVNVTIFFNAMLSRLGWNLTTQPIISYEWDFGDGTNITTTNQTVIHTYTMIGNYTMTLSVTDTQGNRDSITQTMIVNLVEFTPVTLNTVHLHLNYWSGEGTKLMAAFYTYDGDYQGNTTVWTYENSTWVELSTDIPHPQGKPIEVVKLVLTRSAPHTITSFAMCRSYLMEWLLQLDQEWILASPEQRSIIFMEIISLDMQWPYAPP